MKVFYSTDYAEFYPVGCAAIVVAADAREAKRALLLELQVYGLKTDDDSFEVVELVTSATHAIVLRDDL